MISIDITLVYEIITFLVLMFVLNALLYKPVLNILAERKKKTEGAVADAAKVEADVVKGTADYEKKLKETAVKAQEARSAVRQEAAKLEAELMDKAKKEAQDSLQQMRGELTKNRESALKTLKDESKSLSKSIAEKLLDRNVTAAILALILLSPSLALAENGHGGGSSELIWKLFSFGILVVLFGYAWVKFGKPMLESRANEIKKLLAEAETKKAEAEAKLREFDEKMRGLDAKILSIQENIRLEAEEEKKRIIAEAAEAAEKIKKAAQTTAEQETKKAKLEIRDEIATLAVNMAKEILSKEMTPQDQEKLTKAYLEKLRLN